MLSSGSAATRHWLYLVSNGKYTPPLPKLVSTRPSLVIANTAQYWFGCACTSPATTNRPSAARTAENDGTAHVPTMGPMSPE